MSLSAFAAKALQDPDSAVKGLRGVASSAVVRLSPLAKNKSISQWTLAVAQFFAYLLEGGKRLPQKACPWNSNKANEIGFQDEVDLKGGKVKVSSRNGNCECFYHR